MSIVKTFFIAFVLNVLWENAHSVLYVHYQGQPIIEWILLRAAAVDAFLIAGGILVVRTFFPQREIQYLASFWILVAIVIEWWALSSGRWAYSPLMPIIPFLETGLTPTIQLLVLGFATRRASC